MSVNQFGTLTVRVRAEGGGLSSVILIKVYFLFFPEAKGGRAAAGDVDEESTSDVFATEMRERGEDGFISTIKREVALPYHSRRLCG